MKGEKSKSWKFLLPRLHSRRSQYVVVVAVLIVGIAMSATAYIALRARQQRMIEDDFRRDAENRINAIRNALQTDIHELESIQSYLASQAHTSFDDFRNFVAHVIPPRSGIRAVQWAPRVGENERLDFERAASIEILQGFQIKQFNSKSELAAASAHQQYYPIFYEYPPVQNPSPFGFDLMSDHHCRAAMKYALANKTCAIAPMSRSLRVLFGRGDTVALIPVFRTDQAGASDSDSEGGAAGFVAGVLQIENIIENALSSLTPSGVHVGIYDVTDPPKEMLLYEHLSRNGNFDEPVEAAKSPWLELDYVARVGGRNWKILCTAGPEYVSSRTTAYAASVAIGILLLTILSARYLIGIAAQNAKASRLALQLSETNRQLKMQMSDRDQIERALRTSVNQYRQLFSQNPDAIFIADAQTRKLTDCNKKAESLTGYTREEILQLRADQLHPEEVRTKAMEDFDQFAKGVNTPKETLIETKTGERIPVSIIAGAIELNNQTYLLGIMSDIRDRKLAEQQQARSIARLECVNKLQEELFLPLPVEQKFKMITDATIELLDLDFCRIWMIKPGDLCDRGCMHATANDARHLCTHREKCLHLMASSGRYTHLDGNHRRVPFDCYKIGRIASAVDHKFLTNDVTTDPRVHNHQWAKELGLVSFAGYKLRDSNGNPIGVLAMFSKHPVTEEDDAFLSNLAEMTSRVIMDQQAAETIKRENAKLSAMISGMEEGVVFADENNVIVEVNDFFCRFVSTGREQIIGKRIEDVHQGSILAHILQMIERFRTHIGSEPFVFQRPIGNSEVILRLQPIYSEQRYTGVLLNVIDVSELVAARREAEMANKAKSRFLANMSHEIRTPLTAILGYADLLMDPKLNASNRGNYAAVVRRSGEHLLALINDILDLAKIEAGKMLIEIQPCNLVSMLADIASLLRPRAESHEVSFLVEYPGEMPETIMTDGARLRQAILNLAGNAVKFTEKGSVRIVASFLRNWKDGQSAVQIEVIDTGIGISESAMSNLFQPFSQGSLSVVQKFGGTGLGLVISRHIAQMLGGDITVQSVFGQGSTFTLTVPTGNLDGVKMLQHPAEVESDAAGHDWKATAKELTGVRVLLAEDGYDNRELIRTVLCAAGAKIETVENGRLAVEKAQEEYFDVILMDMNMPEMDGQEATRLLRAKGYDRPILALTANAMASDAQASLNAGCNAHLAKPINRAELIRTIAAYVEQLGLSRSAAAPATKGIADSAASETEPIISQYINDPEIAEVIDGFVERLGAQLEGMQHAFAEARHDDLRSLAHKLKGAGGCYGYPMLTDACKTLEDAAKSQDSSLEGDALDVVSHLILAIQKGHALSHTTETSTQ